MPQRNSSELPVPTMKDCHVAAITYILFPNLCWLALFVNFAPWVLIAVLVVRYFMQVSIKNVYANEFSMIYTMALAKKLKRQGKL